MRAGDKMARALLGSACGGRVCRDPHIKAASICGQVLFGRSGGLAFFLETDPQCPRPWGSFPLSSWLDSMATTGAGQWVPAADMGLGVLWDSLVGPRGGRGVSRN